MTAATATTLQGTASRDAAAAGRALAEALRWLWHAYATVVQDFFNHQVPPAGQTAAFAATVAAVLMLVFRSRGRSSG